jgi:hypothetical protein
MGAYDNVAVGMVDPTDVDSKNAKQLAEYFYQSSYPSNSAFWQQGFVDKRFKVGDQGFMGMLFGDEEYFANRRYFFNYILRNINMVGGNQRRNRKSTITLPLHENDALCDDYNAVLKWCEGRDGFAEYFSEAFEGAITTGLNLLNLYIDYTNDPISGDLCTSVVDYNNILLDPNWRKMDFSDLGFGWRRTWNSKERTKCLLPGRDKEIDKLQASNIKDGRFPLQAELLNLDTSRLFPYDEIHYRTTRKAKMIVDPFSGEAVEWEEDKDEVKDALKQILAQQPWLKVKTMDVPTVKLIIMIGSKVMYHGQNLLGIDSYPFVPMVCYREPDMQSYAWRQFGLVRNSRSAQYLFNLRKIIEMDILQSQINSGWIYPTDVVVDPKAFRQKGQGFLVPLKSGHLPSEIQRIDPPAIPQSMIEISKSLQMDIMQICGVNEELLGSAEDDKPGILSMLRQGAGLTTLQSVLDRADYTQKIYGKIRMEAFRKNFSKGKIAGILGKQPHQNFFSSVAQKYSIDVGDGNYSQTQRQKELQQLLYFKEIGMPIADKSIMRAAIICNKDQVIKEMEEQAQGQQQMQQQQAQMQAQKDQADIMTKYAKARRDIAGEADLQASSTEKLAKVEEIHAGAEQKRAAADLDMLKLMISLEDMEFAQLRSNLELAQIIKQQNAQPVA